MQKCEMSMEKTWKMFSKVVPFEGIVPGYLLTPDKCLQSLKMLKVIFFSLNGFMLYS